MKSEIDGSLEVSDYRPGESYWVLRDPVRREIVSMVDGATPVGHVSFVCEEDAELFHRIHRVPDRFVPEMVTTPGQLS